jgi:hypothetical protein
MLTSPVLFTFHSEPGVGFKLPKLPFNPGELLKEKTGVDEYDKTIYGKAITSIANRIEFLHQ